MKNISRAFFALATLGSLGRVALAADQPQLPKAALEQIKEQLEKAGEDGKNLRPAAAPGAARNFAPVVQHYTYCNVPDNGYLQSISLDGPFAQKGKYTVNVFDRKGVDRPAIAVEDAVVEINKWSLFDTNYSTQWGMGGTSRTTTNAWAVRMTISSEKHDLGMVVEGCIGKAVRKVNVITMCFDARSVWN